MVNMIPISGTILVPRWVLGFAASLVEECFGSQAGNTLFPGWEHFIPKVEIF